MNKPIIAAIATLVTLVLAVSVTGAPVQAQYQPGPEISGQSATPEQLQECEVLGIEPGACTETNILAKKRLTSAQEFGGEAEQDSGTAMLSTDLGETGIFLGILGAIFGGVAAMFFFRGRSAGQVKKT